MLEKKSKKVVPKYWEHLKISGSNGLSKCPESREMDFGHFREKYFSTIFSTIFWTIFQNPDLEVQNPDLFMTELSCHPLGARI